MGGYVQGNQKMEGGDSHLRWDRFCYCKVFNGCYVYMLPGLRRHIGLLALASTDLRFCHSGEPASDVCCDLTESSISYLICVQAVQQQVCHSCDARSDVHLIFPLQMVGAGHTEAYKGIGNVQVVCHVYLLGPIACLLQAPHPLVPLQTPASQPNQHYANKHLQHVVNLMMHVMFFFSQLANRQSMPPLAGLYHIQHSLLHPSCLECKLYSKPGAKGMQPMCCMLYEQGSTDEAPR